MSEHPYEQRFLALSLLYGPPHKDWILQTDQNGFSWRSTGVFDWYHHIPSLRGALIKCGFHRGEIDRVTIRRLAYDYAEWYMAQQQEKA